MSFVTPTEIFLTQGDNNLLRRWQVGTWNPVTHAFTPADLTNAAAVEIHAPGMANPTMACTWVADATGTVSRIFVAADMTIAGVFPFETQVTWIDATIATFPKPGSDLIRCGAQLG